MKHLITSLIFVLIAFASTAQNADSANPGQSYLDTVTVLMICGVIVAFLFIVVYALAKAVNALSGQAGAYRR